MPCLCAFHSKSAHLTISLIWIVRGQKKVHFCLYHNQAFGVDFNKPTSSSNCVIICCLRHWQKLMESTGKNFDMNPETFTLENLFAMELHNFADTISDIVGSANKELSIEKSLNEVVTTWHSQRFSIYK